MGNTIDGMDASYQLVYKLFPFLKNCEAELELGKVYGQNRDCSPCCRVGRLKVGNLSYGFLLKSEFGAGLWV